MANFIKYGDQTAVNLDIVGVIKLHARSDWYTGDVVGVQGQPSIAFYSSEPQLKDDHLIQSWAFGDAMSSSQDLEELDQEAEHVYNYIMNEHLCVTKIPISDKYKEYMVQAKLLS